MGELPGSVRNVGRLGLRGCSLMGEVYRLEVISEGSKYLQPRKVKRILMSAAVLESQPATCNCRDW